MNSIIFKIYLFICCLTVNSYGQYTDEELTQIGTDALKIRRKVHPNKRVTTFRKALEGLKDSEKIRAMALSLLDKEKNAKLPMSTQLGGSYVYVLGQDRELISDYSELRKMLKSETDPRKFYLVSVLIPWYIDKKHDYVASFSHMLFSSGPVTENVSEYARDYSGDVTYYAYISIVGNLKLLEADFTPPDKKIPHKERVLILAKWLKENWKGCEELKIPETSSDFVKSSKNK